MSEQGEFDPTKKIIYGNTASGWDPEDQLALEGFTPHLSPSDRAKNKWEEMEYGLDPEGLDASIFEVRDSGLNIAVLYGKKVDKDKIREVYKKWFGDEIEPPFDTDQ